MRKRLRQYPSPPPLCMYRKFVTIIIITTVDRTESLRHAKRNRGARMNSVDIRLASSHPPCLRTLVGKRGKATTYPYLPLPKDPTCHQFVLFIKLKVSNRCDKTMLSDTASAEWYHRSGAFVTTLAGEADGEPLVQSNYFDSTLAQRDALFSME